MADWTDAHTNTEGELVLIDRAGGDFEDQPLLVLVDDHPPRGTAIRAPMLLDPGTRRWLRRQLDRLDKEG